jgi:ferredoxin
MAIIITEDCINCNNCITECPNTAIYQGGVEWAMQDGTNISENFNTSKGEKLDVKQKYAPISNDVYYIVPYKCTECQGFHTEPQCAAVCPVDCCVPDKLYQETIEELLKKKAQLHIV